MDEGLSDRRSTVAPSPVVAVGAICVKGAKLLMVRRGQPPEAGRWSVPGGKVEPGETLAQAVERETLEETGLEVRCAGLRGWVERISPGYHYVILDFDVVLLHDGPVRPACDASDARWVGLAEIASLDTVSGLEEFLAEHRVLEDSPTRRS